MAPCHLWHVSRLLVSAGCLLAFDLCGSPKNVPKMTATLGIRMSSMKTTRVGGAAQNLSLLVSLLTLLLIITGCSGSYGGGGGGNAPYISGLSVASGPVGTAVTITGTHFGATQGSSTVTFNGKAATPTSWSDTSIAAPVPSGATTGLVLVTVGSVASNGSTFTVTSTPGPNITSLNPTSGPVGTSITMNGTNFGTSQGNSTIKFNGTAATPSSWSSTSIVAPVPTGATSGYVVVTVGGVASNNVTFTVTTTSSAPTITSLNPTSGPVGSSVTITGTNLGSSQGSSTVTFYNNQAATVTSWSATSIGVTVPANATTGNVVVTVGGVASNGVSFTVATMTASAFPIKLSANKRYFVDANGNPWLMVADAAHHLMPVIGSTNSSILQYLNDRKTNGFNTINFYGACASNSGTCPPSGAANNGQLPFLTGNSSATYDLSTPNPNYWSQVDNVINQASSLGLVVLFEPLPWGNDFGTSMEPNTPPVNYKSCGNPVTLPCTSNDYNFGVFLGNRYKNFPNIIWQFGQDFRGTNLPDATFMDYQAQVIAGVASVDTNHLINAQMNYYRSYTQQAESLANANFNSHVNVSFVYTYYETYDYAHLAYAASPTMPAFLGESNYETANNTNLLSSPANAFITRMEMWWPVTSGAAGFEFGNEHVNHFDSTSPTWQFELDTTATLQVKYVAQLLTTLPWQNLVPDTNHAIVTGGFGTCSGTSTTIGPNNENLYNATCATTAADSLTSATLALTYTPVSTTNLTVDMTTFSKTTINASWYDPTTGASQAINGSPFSNTSTQMFSTPSTAHADGTHDWVLVLQ